jgi:selenocysteine lyase/cysteine desulfurase
VPGTRHAIDYCLRIGEDRIWPRVKSLDDYRRTRLSELDKVSVLDRGREVGGLVTFHVEGSDPVWLTQALVKQKINGVPGYRNFAVIDFDEKGVSLHLYV